MKNIPAIIHATLAVGSAAATPYYDVNISQQLCMPVCYDETPVFKPEFTIQSVAPVGTNQYVINVHVEGAIAYVPCGCNCCATKTQVVSQDFTIPVYSATAVTGATLAVGTTANAMVKTPCKLCSRSFVSDTPIIVTIIKA